MFRIIPGTFRESALQLVQNVQNTIILLGVKVTVSIPRLLDPRVPEARRNGLDIDVGVNQQAGVTVPLRYNYDKPEKPRRIKGFEVFSLVFSSFSKPKNHTEISRIIGGVSLTTNE